MNGIVQSSFSNSIVFFMEIFGSSVCEIIKSNNWFIKFVLNEKSRFQINIENEIYTNLY